MDYKTIERVPIVSTGTYKLGTGETTFTADDLASAVLAANDATVSLPRIKIGHIDQRFENDESLDGEPAMGTARNLTLTDDGQTILADLTDVPAWLADSMASAYPGRSVEGGFGYEAPSGHKYGFTISSLALLGTTWPGVATLDDLKDVLTKNGPVKDGVEAKSERFVMAAVGSLDAEDEAEIQKLMREKGLSRAAAEKQVKESADEKREEAKASLDVGGIPRVFAADLTAGKVPKSGDLDQSKWWARSVEASDDGKLSILVDTAAGKLLRLPITVAEKALSYGSPTEAVAASGTFNNLQGPRVLASWPSGMSTAQQEAKKMQINGAEVDQAALAKRLGLAEGADEAAIEAALTAPETAETPAATTDTAGTASDAAAPSSTTASAKLPEGIVAIDATKLAEIQAKAEAGADVAASLAVAHRDQTITNAITGGRIAASRREHFERSWKVDPEGTEKLLTAKVEDGGLAVVIPVEQIETGRAGDGSGDVAASAPRLLPELQEAAA